MARANAPVLNKIWLAWTCPPAETEKSEVTWRDLVLLSISPRSGHEWRNYGASV